ncbi:MAG: hypothetical protein FWC34_10570 [Bacteroidetes bacterium]|nr:hypothetical protein [Bacteroidota bacterium]MCL2302550.1 hypothetical protein [Lentimicrobiaceae bacterium]
MFLIIIFPHYALIPRYFILENQKSDDGRTAILYETELQLFSKKCEVELQKHSKIVQRGAETSKKRAENFLRKAI